MSALQAEVYEAFRILEVSDEKALRAAVALSAALAKVEDDTSRSFNKRDADIDGIRKDVTSLTIGFTKLDGDVNLIKWMLGTTFAAVVTVLFRVFTH